MSLRHRTHDKRTLIFFAFVALLLLSIPAAVRKSQAADSNGLLQFSSQASTSQAAEYEVIVLSVSSQLSDSVGQSINAGQSVGTGRITDAPDPDQTHAVLWQHDGLVFVDLHPSGFRYSAALETDGIQQVGHGNGPPTGFARHALLWSSTANSYVDLHPPGNWTDSIARAIAGYQQVGNINIYYQGNESSPLSIEHAALWRGSADSVVDLHPSGIGCDRSYANDTDGSQQVGYGYFARSGTTSPYRALLWSATASSAVILHPPGFSHSFAEGVSRNEQVGYGFNVWSDGYSRALLWHGTAASVVNLNPPGYFATSALATNGTNQVGFGGSTSTNWRRTLCVGKAPRIAWLIYTDCCQRSSRRAVPLHMTSMQQELLPVWRKDPMVRPLVSCGVGSQAAVADSDARSGDITSC